MPAFLTAEFWNWENPELWVAAGLLIFIGILVLAGVPKLVAANLDARAGKVRHDLEEAARIRAEAEALLATLKAERAQAEAQAAAILDAAQADAKRQATEAKAKLEDQLKRRAALAERKIASAEAQAAADVKAAAADMAAQIAEQVLTARLAGAKSDPLVDQAISGMAGKLQ